MQLFKDTHLTKLELLSDATTIDSALNFIKSKQSQQEKESSQKTSDSVNDDDDSNNSQITAATTTTTGKQTVF